MPFRVADDVGQRVQAINEFLSDGQQMVAVVVAAADFERTLRRLIIALGNAPTADVRQALERQYFSIGKYPAAWRRFVEPTHGPLGQVLNYAGVKKAFALRNRIVHGAQGTAGPDFCRKRIDTITAATRELTVFAAKRGVDLTERLRVRRRPRGAP